MKKTLLPILFLVSSLLSFSACKKEEQDKGMSCADRIAGHWTSTDNLRNGTPLNVTIELELNAGGTGSLRWVYSDGSDDFFVLREWTVSDNCDEFKFKDDVTTVGGNFKIDYLGDNNLKIKGTLFGSNSEVTFKR